MCPVCFSCSAMMSQVWSSTPSSTLGWAFLSFSLHLWLTYSKQQGEIGLGLLRLTLVPKSSELICSCAPGESQIYLLYTLWHAWTTYCVWEKPWPSQGCAWSVRHGKHKRLNYGKALTHIFTPVGAFSHFLFSLAQGFTTDRQFWWAWSEQHF